MDKLQKGYVYSVSGDRAKVVLEGETEPTRPGMRYPAGAVVVPGRMVTVVKVSGVYMINQVYGGGE